MLKKCNKFVQTDSIFRTESSTQTNDSDDQSSIKQQYHVLNNIYPDDINLISNNQNGIHFTVSLNSLLNEDQQCSQILLHIKGPIFEIEIDFISSFLEEEKCQLQSIANKSDQCNLLETIFLLEAKLIELEKEFTKRKEQIQYHYSLTGSFQNIDYTPQLQQNTSKADIVDEQSKQDQKSTNQMETLKNDLIEKYDGSELQFNSAPAPTVQVAQLTVSSQSRFNYDFCEIQLIGSGGFGKVFKSRNKFDGNYYALKRIALDYSNSKLTEKTKNEAVLLSRIQHPNIVRYYQAWTEEYFKDQYEKDEDEEYDDSDEESESEEEQITLNLRKGSSQDDEDEDFDNYYEQEEDIQINWVNDNQVEEEVEEEISEIPVQIQETKQQRQLLYIQMEYCTGDTLKKKIDERSLNSEQKKKIIRQILDALYYLHKNNIIHRDLKPQNIFLDGNLNVKLGDFGLATEMKQEIKQIDNKFMKNSIQNPSLTSGVGTIFYLAPEQEQSQYDAKVDVYSLGIILFEMYYPFKTDMERIKYMTQLRTEGVLPNDFDAKVPKADLEIRDKIQMLVKKDPKKRPETGVLLNEYKDKRVQQVIRSIANPNCPDFYELVQTLFECRQLKQSNNLITSCLEEALTKSPEMFIKDFQKNLNELCNRVEILFKQRGSIKLNLSPLIAPENYLRYQTLSGHLEEYENTQHVDQSFRFITQDGGIVQFCQNLLQPTIYWLKMLPLNNFRRYSFGEVQHTNRETFSKQHCATYDILQDKPIHQTHLLELLSISRDVINQFQDPYNFELRICHTQLFELIVMELGFNYQILIRLQRHSTFQYKLLKYMKMQHHNNSQTQRELHEILTLELNFSDDKAAKLLQFLQLKQHFLITKNEQKQHKDYEKKNIDLKLKRTFADQIKPFFTKYTHQLQTILNEIELFLKLATESNLLGEIRIVLEVFQCNELTCYYSGITFEVISIVKEQKSNQLVDIVLSKTESTKKDIKKHLKSNCTSYIIGGDYSHYLSNQSNQKYGCGIQIYLDQIYFNKFLRYLNDQPGRFQTFAPLQFYFPITEIRSMCVTAVILSETGTLQEAFILAQHIWNMKQSVKYLYIEAIIILFDKGSKNLASSYTKDFEIRVKAQDKFCIKRRNLKEEERTLLSTLNEIETGCQQKNPLIQCTQSCETKSTNQSKPNNEQLRQSDTKPSFRLNINAKVSRQARKTSQRPNQQKRRGQSSIDNQ